MDKPPEDKTIPRDADKTAAPSGANAATLPDANGEKSWGDKYKKKLHSLTRNIGVNYIVNFAISALGTNAVVESKWYQFKAQPWLDEQIEKVSTKTHIPNKFARVIVEFFTITQLLLCGGHSLLPYMKWSHDNRKRQEFELGHKLDEAQLKLGRGNEATKQRVREYTYIKDLLKANKPENLSDDDKALLARNNIDDKLQFQENRQTWKQVLKARGVGMAATTTLSLLFAVGSFFGGRDHLNMPAIDVKKTWLEGGGHWFADLPGVRSVFKAITKDHPRLIEGQEVMVEGHRVLGAYVVLELIYTMASKLGFDHMEHRALKNQQKKEEAEATANLAQDKKFLKSASIRADDAADIQTLRTASVRVPTALEARRKIVENGGKDFRAREASKVNEPSIALS